MSLFIKEGSAFAAPQNLKEGKGKPMTTIVETASYKLAGDVARDDFLAANSAMTDWLSRQSGFQYRSLSQKDDGTWVDIAYWEDKAAADASEASFKKEMLSTDFCMMVDPATMEMAKSEVATYFMATEAA